jgi:hypothetical protein
MQIALIFARDFDHGASVRENAPVARSKAPAAATLKFQIPKARFQGRPHSVKEA